ncbi:hypothetical protein [Streptomyces sp. NPDC026092]|uniref:hypothetical protein n=1 Tax=Streptomyces sp. NPDC026092 TaxID=3154797 RepID=UPI0033D88E9E
MKDFSRVLTQVEGQRPGGSPSAPVATLTTDQAWFDRVVDREANTPEYRASLPICRPGRRLTGDGLPRTSVTTNADVKATYYVEGQVYRGGAGTGFGHSTGAVSAPAEVR